MSCRIAALAAILSLPLIAACNEEPSEDRAATPTEAPAAAPTAQPVENPAAAPVENQPVVQPETPAVAPSEAQNAPLPAPVADALAAFAKECSDASGTPQTDNAVKRADLNGDGRDDFVLFAGWIGCENAWSIYGDREKSLTVFAGDDAQGAVSAFSNMVFDATIETAGGTPKLWLSTSGAACGKPPAGTFAEESFCDRAIVPKGAAAFEYAPVDTVRMIE